MIERTCIRRQHHGVGVVAEEGDGRRALDFTEHARDGGRHVQGLAAMAVDEAEDNLRVRIQLAVDLRMALPQRCVVGDDAIVHADAMIGNNGLVVADERFRACRYQSAVADDGHGSDEATFGIHVERRQVGVQEHPVIPGPEHPRGRTTALEYLRRPIVGDHQTRRLAPPRFGKLEQSGQRALESGAVAGRAPAGDKTKDPAHAVSLKTFPAVGQAPPWRVAVIAMELPLRLN